MQRAMPDGCGEGEREGGQRYRIGLTRRVGDQLQFDTGPAAAAIEWSTLTLPADTDADTAHRLLLLAAYALALVDTRSTPCPHPIASQPPVPSTAPHSLYLFPPSTASPACSAVYTGSFRIRHPHHHWFSAALHPVAVSIVPLSSSPTLSCARPCHRRIRLRTCASTW